MAIQKLETYAWGAIKRVPKEVGPGTTVDLGLGAQIRVQDKDSVLRIQSNTGEWEGYETKTLLTTSEINDTLMKAEGGIRDLIIGHRILYQWAPH